MSTEEKGKIAPRWMTEVMLEKLRDAFAVLTGLPKNLVVVTTKMDGVDPGDDWVVEIFSNHGPKGPIRSVQLMAHGRSEGEALQELSRILEMLTKSTRGELEDRLTSYFYELARDHTVIGVLNKMLRNSIKSASFSDPELATWARRHANSLMRGNYPHGGADNG
jgi:hypothetical protein